MAGFATVLVDLSVYTVLLALGAPVSPAKAGAFICGATFAFFANKNFTFRAGKGNFGQFAAVFAVYCVSMIVNVTANAAVIGMIGESIVGKATAYLAALSLSATLNFLGMRRILSARRPSGVAGGVDDAEPNAGPQRAVFPDP